MSDLIRLLQGLGDAEHDDLDVAYDALAEIVRLREDLADATAEIEQMRSELDMAHKANADAYDSGRDSVLDEIEQLQSEIAGLSVEAYELEQEIERLRYTIHKAGGLASQGMSAEIIRQVLAEGLQTTKDSHSCGRFQVGDRGQRYEVTYYDTGDDQRKVFGWTDDAESARRMCDSVEKHPEWKWAQLRDRTAPGEELSEQGKCLNCGKPESEHREGKCVMYFDEAATAAGFDPND